MVPEQYEFLSVPTYGEGVAGSEVHPRPELLVLRLTSHAYVGVIDPDELVDYWQADLVYPGTVIAVELGREDDTLEDLVLARGSFAVLDLERCASHGVCPSEALAADSADFADLNKLFDGGRFADDLDVSLPPSGLVVAERVFVPGPFRGRRFGLLLTALTLRELGRSRLVVCRPGAFDVDPTSPGREVADARIRRLCRRFGFRRYRDDVFYLDTNLWPVEDRVNAFSMDIRAAPRILLPRGCCPGASGYGLRLPPTRSRYSGRCEVPVLDE